MYVSILYLHQAKFKTIPIFCNKIIIFSVKSNFFTIRLRFEIIFYSNWIKKGNEIVLLYKIKILNVMKELINCMSLFSFCHQPHKFWIYCSHYFFEGQYILLKKTFESKDFKFLIRNDNNHIYCTMIVDK